MLARKALRKLAYARYRKHFDPDTINYYYLDKETLQTFWKKPYSFGSYDVDADAGWVVMRDSEREMYYYCPQSWEMSWEQPFSTILCEICNEDFACARLNYDVLLYCGNCFNKKVVELMTEQHMTADDIYFKPCAGNKSGARNTAFTYVKDENYQRYLMLNDPSIAAQMLALDGSKKRVVIKKKEKVILADKVFCPHCVTGQAVKRCFVCEDVYCDDCFNTTHIRAPWSNHATEALPTPGTIISVGKTQEEIDALNARRQERLDKIANKDGKKKKKDKKNKKHKKKHKKEGEIDGSASEGESVASEVKKKKKKKKDVAVENTLADEDRAEIGGEGTELL